MWPRLTSAPMRTCRSAPGWCWSRPSTPRRRARAPTVSVALADGMRCIGKNAMLALRRTVAWAGVRHEGRRDRRRLGPGGAHGEHQPALYRDLHAITAANNLLCAMVDNHIQQGNALGIAPAGVLPPLSGRPTTGSCAISCRAWAERRTAPPREDGFDITAASEVMATFCLASDLKDLKARLGPHRGRAHVSGRAGHGGRSGRGGRDDRASARRVQPQPHPDHRPYPCLMHGGPFANIAHGCNSVAATRLALRMSDYTVTEAGVRRGPGRGEVPGYQVPHERPVAQRDRAGGHGARAQA